VASTSLLTAALIEARRRRRASAVKFEETAAVRLTGAYRFALADMPLVKTTVESEPFWTRVALADITLVAGAVKDAKRMALAVALKADETEAEAAAKARRFAAKDAEELTETVSVALKTRIAFALVELVMAIVADTLIYGALP
jgi:hypothetical protein